MLVMNLQITDKIIYYDNAMIPRYFTAVQYRLFANITQYYMYPLNIEWLMPIVVNTSLIYELIKFLWACQ